MRGRKVRFGLIRIWRAIDLVRAAVDLWPLVREELRQLEDRSQAVREFVGYLEQLRALARRRK